MKHKAVYCEKCSGEIKTQKDLVVVGAGVIPRAYHEKCYIQVAKKPRQTIGGRYVINHPNNKILSVLILILCIGLMVITKRYLTILIALFILEFHKVYSLLRYERHLK